MKKILLLSAVIGSLLTGSIACSPIREWSRDQRRTMRESLRNYRQMAYLDDLTDAEFIVFSNDVAEQLEADYPIYATFTSMPGLTDTVDIVVISTIVNDLNTDARNMRHLYPYLSLTAEGVLPKGLDREQLQAFYKCLSHKINGRYHTMRQFVQAIMADTTDRSQIRRLQGQCANELFNWTISEVDIIEVE